MLFSFRRYLGCLLLALAQVLGGQGTAAETELPSGHAWEAVEEVDRPGPRRPREPNFVDENRSDLPRWRRNSPAAWVAWLRRLRGMCSGFGRGCIFDLWLKPGGQCCWRPQPANMRAGPDSRYSRKLGLCTLRISWHCRQRGRQAANKERKMQRSSLSLASTGSGQCHRTVREEGPILKQEFRGEPQKTCDVLAAGLRLLVSVAATPALATLEEEGEFGAPATASTRPCLHFRVREHAHPATGLSRLSRLARLL